MSQDKLVLIRQALAAAESSIKTAKQLLSEVESGGLHVSAKDLPGVVGVFDGVNMVGEGGEKIEVPANYASKSMLVVGDTLKQVDENGEKRFKQIEHVKRHKTTGILHKKDGKFKVITPEGSYNVVESAVEHFSGQVGDEVVLHLPAGNLTASYGAIERILKPGESVEDSSISEEAPSESSVPEAPKVVEAPVGEKKEVVAAPARPAPVKVESNKDNAASAQMKKKKNRRPTSKSSAEKPVSAPPTPRPVVAVPAPQPVSVPMPAPGEDDELR